MIGLGIVAALLLGSPKTQPQGALPIRALHMMSPDPAGLNQCISFIEDALPKEGVNTLVMEFDYRFKFKSHPEVTDSDALSFRQVRQIVAACKQAHVRLIPLMDLLGHQSWAGTTNGLLRSHPDFDETPGKYPGNKGIYCRSYCPLNPNVHKVVFALIDELANACEATAFHVGMDEVMILGDKDCPYCHGKSTTELFADEVNTLHAHLKSKGLQMWMWGDRFIDGNATGIGKWEASENGTAPAVDHVPKDIVICDWQYDEAHPTAAYFASKGFQVVSCPFDNASVALQELQLQLQDRSDSDAAFASKPLGMMQTSWCSCAQFIDAYYGKADAPKDAVQAANCFKTLFQQIRAR